MSRFAKIEGYEDYIKDQKTGAILLSNQVKANEYLNKKRSIEESATVRKEINTMKEDMEQIKQGLDSIKSLLQQLASNGTQ